MLLLGGVLAGAYYWPSDPEDLAKLDEADAAALVLPTEPEAIPVEQIRSEGVQAVANVLERYPDSPGSHHAAATLYQFLNQYDVVVRHWERCIALDPRDAVAREWLAKVQLKKGEDAQATRTLELAIEAGLGNAEICHQYAAVLQRSNKLAEAEKVARDALQKYPDHRDLWIALGQTQLQLAQLENARASLDQALRIDPQSNTAHFAAAAVCLRLGDKEAAAAHRKIVDESRATRKREQLPFDETYERSLRVIVATVLSAVGTEYDSHGEVAEAERLCRRAYAISPGSPDPYRQLANMYFRDKKFRQALAVQRRLMVVEPQNFANYLNYASLAFQVGQPQEGEGALLEASRVLPENPIVPHNLAVIYMRGGQVDKARQFAERSIRLEPSLERYLLLASACRRLGDLEGAEAADQAAQRLASAGR